MAAPALRPGVGFCVQTDATTGNPPARWYVNVTKHRLVEMPVAYSGKSVDREFILTHGITNLQIPFDIGSFRKLKMRSDGARQTTFCIDVVFNPLIIQLFMEDDFCKVMENFRQFIINLALKRIDESVGVKLSVQKITLVKKTKYKDGEDGDDDCPREFEELPGNPDCFDAEYPQKAKPTPEPEAAAETLIEDVSKPRKPAMKKGFLNSGKNGKASAELYPNGSGEGVVPENAGDPMGWLPKKLRNTCKIVDTNSPEYQQNENQRKAAEKTNAMNQEMKDTISQGMDFWTKKQEREKWEQDLPDGTEKVQKKYEVDYSRFDKIVDEEDAPVVEDRDYYFDDKGERRQITKPPTSASSPPEAAKADALKKGFLSGAKSLYPEGSSEGKGGMSEEQMMKTLMEDFPEEAKQIGLSEDTPSTTSASKPSMKVKTADYKTAEFTLTEVEDGLQLVVDCPGLQSMKGVNLDVSDTRAGVAFPSDVMLKPLEVKLPKSICAQVTRAKFSKKTSKLTISLPFTA